MKTINYFQNKMNEIDIFNTYSKGQKDYVANYFYLLFMQLSKMTVTENNCIRELCELEQFLFMYINILNLIKDQDDNKTSHDIIGSIITGQAIYLASSEIDIQKQNSEKKHSSKWLK